MFLDDLPHCALYHLCKYLSLNDILNVSITCQNLYKSIEGNDYFWIKLIQNQFGFQLYQRHVHEVFQNERNSNYDFYDTFEDREKFEKKYKKIEDMFKCYTWLSNILNYKDNSNGYLAYQRIRKQKTSPRTNDLKMCTTTAELFQYYMLKNETLTEENLCRISICKLIYFYLNESKRLSCLDVMPITICCRPSSLKTKFCTYEFDVDSSTSQRVRLDGNFRALELGIRGTFKSILPGNYQIVCRIKLDKNDKYLSYFNQRFVNNQVVEEDVLSSFHVYPDYGIDCQRDKQILTYKWFESNYLQYGNTKWFDQVVGHIQVFKLSDVYFGLRFSGHRYRILLFDYIQLNIIV